MSCSFVKLGDVCTINPRLPKDTDESQKVSFLSMSCVSAKGKIHGQETRILAETKKGFTYFERGDNLLAKITPCFENGKAVHTSELENPIGYGSTEFHVLRANNEAADGKYIFYLIWNDVFRFHGKHSMKGAAGQKRVSADFLKNLKIPLPPLPEQQKIAAILDAADQLRQKDQQLIDHYTTLCQSLFLQMFGDPVTNSMGWDTLPLGEMLEFITSGSRGWAKYYSEHGDLFLRIQNIGNNQLFLDDVAYVHSPDNAEAKRTTVKTGDILLSITADLGRTAVIPKNIGKAHINQHLAILRLQDKYDPNYVSEYISSVGGKRQFNKMDKGGVKAGLNFTDIKSLNILNPPIERQKKYIDIVQKILAQKQQAQTSLAQSEALFNSLLQRVFKGELTGSRAAL